MRNLFIVIITMAIFVGCSKTEEEDPSATTPQELILGDWDCTSWTMNGAEIMENVEYYTMEYYLESSVETFEFEYKTSTDGVKWQGSYEFEDNNSKLKTTYENQWFWNGSAWAETTPDEAKSWDIDKLTETSLEISYIISSNGNDTYFKMILTK